MQTPLVELRQVKLRQGNFLLQVDRFQLQPGEILAMTGPNGSGKTTLLSILHLLRRPQEGEVLFEGEAVHQARRARLLQCRRRIGSILQEPAFLKGILLDNVALPLRLSGLNPKQACKNAMTWLERLGLADLAARPCHTLSAGQARRGMLARALVTEPKLLLLDEPFSNLDIQWRSALLADMPPLIRETGAATVLITHDPEEAVRWSERRLSLSEGKIVENNSQ